MKYPFADTLVMIAELAIKPKKPEDFIDYTVNNLDISRAAAGNITFEILIDEVSPNLVRVYEIW